MEQSNTKLKGSELSSIEAINKTSQNLEANANIEIETKDLNEEQIRTLISNLKLTGFTGINNDNRDVIVCKKKVFNKKSNNQNGGTNSESNPWKVLKVEQKSDLVYEDELVDPFDNYQKFAKESDCITKPKPCKNCNCGRADAEKKDTSVKDFKPSCGKCYMGDAFRCAGCPYRGMAAFNPGDKVQFNVEDNIVNNDATENGATKVSGNKVKIDL